MKTSDLSHLQSLLKEERAAVLDVLEAHLERTSGDEPTSVDEKILSDEERLLEKIDLALARIEEGTYGICMGCSSPIPLQRLLAKPSVSLCVACQTQKEAAK